MNRDKQPVSACNMSVAQQEYVAREIRRHRQVTICRVMPVSYTHLTLPTNREV